MPPGQESGKMAKGNRGLGTSGLGPSELQVHVLYRRAARALDYSQHKFRTAATTLLATVLDRCATDPLSPGATFWIPGVKTEIAAKKRRKNEQKWARYGR